nr:hypothetical protein CFP56_09063 [Quercus suber]
MSNERSHSAVRNLRSIFENKNNNSTLESRGRSPNGFGSDKENTRPRSKIRASFVAVEPSKSAMAEATGMEELKQVTSADLRRDGFSEEDAEEQKQPIAAEQERRALDSDVKETIPESGIESVLSTPLVETTKTLGDVNVSGGVQVVDKPAENPDKPTTGVEEEPLEMKPADLTSQDAVSGGEALPSVAEDLKPASSKDLQTGEVKGGGKPSSISTKAPAKASSSSLKSPLSQPKTPTTKPTLPTKTEPSMPTTKSLIQKPSRSSLAAPTAASVARAAAAIEKSVAAHSSVYSPPAKPKSKDVTKPLDISARLTAPTAASRARQEQAHSTSTSSSEKVSLPTHIKPTSSTRSTPRSSLAGGQRSASRVSFGASSRKPPPPPDGSFLERMTRPTAASQNRAQEKVELRSPQRPAHKPAAPPKVKPNGHARAPRPSISAPAEVGPDTTTLDESALLDQAAVETNGLAEETKEAIAPTFDPALDAAAVVPEILEAGNETPLAHPNAEEAEGRDMEATPAFKADETIR